MCIGLQTYKQTFASRSAGQNSVLQGRNPFHPLKPFCQVTPLTWGHFWNGFISNCVQSVKLSMQANFLIPFPKTNALTENLPEKMLPFHINPSFIEMFANVTLIKAQIFNNLFSLNPER